MRKKDGSIINVNRIDFTTDKAYYEYIMNIM